jgi:hypothetical protein
VDEIMTNINCNLDLKAAATFLQVIWQDVKKP